jgi:hypothetical protein
MRQQEIATVVSYGWHDGNLETRLAPTFFGACVHGNMKSRLGR